MPPRILAVVGPTACGKTSLGIVITKHRNITRDNGISRWSPWNISAINGADTQSRA